MIEIPRVVSSLPRICPYCGVKIEGIAEQADHCPACGRELTPRKTQEEIGTEVRKVEGRRDMLLFFGIAGIFFGLMLLLPDVILFFIMDPGDEFTIFFPINAILVFLGISLLIIRYPYAKRLKDMSRVYRQYTEESLICQYCGSKNITGFTKCEFCGAPVSPANDND